MLPVEVPFSGALPVGYSVQQKNIEPQELEIVGPESRVRAAQRLVSDPFDLTVAGLTGTTEQVLSVYAPDPELSFLGDPRVTVKILVHRLP
jgi:hypothetical protein